MESTSGARCIPSLLYLPLELMLEIISCLSPTSLAELRLTHTLFTSLISKADVQRSRLEWVETNYAYPSPRSHYACYTCLRLLPTHNFCDDSKTGMKSTGGRFMQKRFCLDCGVEKNLYPKGAPVPIGGRYRSPCQHCGHFFFGRENELCTPDCPEYMQRKAN